MRFASRPILGSILILALLGQFVCCVIAAPVHAQASAAPVRSCCARGQPQTPVQKVPCESCPMMNGSKVMSSAAAQHVDLLPDLVAPIANIAVASVSCDSLPVGINGHDDDPVPICSDLFQQTCLLTL